MRSQNLGTVFGAPEITTTAAADHDVVMKFRKGGFPPKHLIFLGSLKIILLISCGNLEFLDNPEGNSADSPRCRFACRELQTEKEFARLTKPAADRISRLSARSTSARDPILIVRQSCLESNWILVTYSRGCNSFCDVSRIVSRHKPRIAAGSYIQFRKKAKVMRKRFGCNLFLLLIPTQMRRVHHAARLIVRIYLLKYFTFQITIIFDLEWFEKLFLWKREIERRVFLSRYFFTVRSMCDRKEAKQLSNE